MAHYHIFAKRRNGDHNEKSTIERISRFNVLVCTSVSLFREIWLGTVFDAVRCVWTAAYKNEVKRNSNIRIRENSNSQWYGSFDDCSG